METCYKMINTKIAQSLSLKEKRFGFEPELTAKLSRIPAIRIYEVGISYYGRTYEEGKKIGGKMDSGQSIALSNTIYLKLSFLKKIQLSTQSFLICFSYVNLIVVDHDVIIFNRFNFI